MTDRPRIMPKRVEKIQDSDLIRMSRGGSRNDVTISWRDASGQIVDEVAQARAAMVAGFAAQQQAATATINSTKAQQDAIAAMQTAMGARITEIAALQTAMGVRISEIASLQAEINARARVIEMGNIQLTQTASIAIAAGIRTLTFTVSGLQANDRTLLFPNAALPTGYYIVSVIASAANTLQVSFQAPLLAIGASFSIVCRAVVIR